MKPFWREAGITHPGRGYDIGENREFIKWGRIFSGRPSYVNWQRDGKLCNGGVICRITYQVWENKGEGGTSQKGMCCFSYIQMHMILISDRRWHLLGRYYWFWC